MRKIIFGCAASLDNFIARSDGGLDWLRWSDEVSAIIAESQNNFDTFIVGRRTYEAGLKASDGKSPFTRKRTFIFSTTLNPDSYKDAEIIATDALEFVKNLKSQDGRDICLMGGGNFARSLFEAGLVDEIGLNIHPVLLGSGIPLFLEMKRQIDLELIEGRMLKNGCLFLTYRITRH